MTTSSYTPLGIETLEPRSGRVRAAIGGVTSRTLAPLRLAVADGGRRSMLVRSALDVIAIAWITLAFAASSLPADLLFHCAFVSLVLHAFLFGLRGTLVRTALVSLAILAYANADSFGLDFAPFELAEWPLMFVIAILVALMADRVNSTSRHYAALFREASERLLTVEDAERRRVGAELHDDVGQVLTALTLNLDAAGGERSLPAIRRQLLVARQLAATALAGTRDLSHRLRPQRLEERGLIAAITDLAAQSGFHVSVEADREARAAAARLTPNTMVEVYRIVQESLANAARHSGASAALVTFSVRAGRLILEVSDEGRGFDPSAHRDDGIGLAGMAERARLAGGQLWVASRIDGGTRVTVRLPLRQAALS